MQLAAIDWAIIAAFFVLTLAIGAIVSKRAGTDSSEFFLSGRNMPWWLLGFSMVATTFAADTPLLVTDIVRKNGVAGNWVWWAFLLTGMLTVFVYAKLWRRSHVLTDIEFYELRYSGQAARFLRGFRALYLGVFFNVMVMAIVTLAAIKIGAVMLGTDPVPTILIASTVAVVFSAMGGLRGVLLTDFVLFVVAMVGSIGAAYVALSHPDVGGLSGLFAHASLQGKLAMVPPLRMDTTEQMNMLITLLILPLAVQWWSVWYPGAEPGGGGYIAQRMLAARDERNATGATLFFNAAHYALRPWPWILVALASLVVYPDLESLRQAFPDVAESTINDDMAYPAMLTLLPIGMRGLVVASLIAAYMSTISTHLNWGSSYVVNDFWTRFVQPDAGAKQQVRIGRISTVLMMVLAAILALSLENALQGFNILLQVGAGTGLLFILRWFWWRISPYSELAAMIVSFVVAVWTQWFAPAAMPDWAKLTTGVAVTTLGWLVVTYLTPPDDDETLIGFYRLVHPGGRGWRAVLDRAAAAGIPLEAAPSGIGVGLQCMVAGCLAVYSALFATGYWLYGDYTLGAVLSLVAVAASIFLASRWDRVHAT